MSQPGPLSFVTARKEPPSCPSVIAAAEPRCEASVEDASSPASPVSWMRSEPLRAWIASMKRGCAMSRPSSEKRKL